MAISKKYFHDHLVLLLLSVNVFLALAGCIFILVKLQHRPLQRLHRAVPRLLLNPSAYQQVQHWQPSQISSGFVVFALIVLARSCVSLSLQDLPHPPPTIDRHSQPRHPTANPDNYRE